MNARYDDFIGVYNNVYPPGYCKFLIDQFNLMETEGVGLSRQQSESASRHHKDDYQISLTDDIVSRFLNEDKEQVSAKRIFIGGLQRCFEDYVNKYSILKGVDTLSKTIKLQRTGPGQGYHVWHCEQGSGEHASRNLVWMVYLNTLDESEAGETEFLYQQKRYRPTENTMIIWPAAFTHAHRGNTVFGQNYKYVATGWFYLQA